MSTAKPGPMAPSTPIRLARDAQVGEAPGDDPMAAHEGDPLRRSWSNSSRTARPAASPGDVRGRVLRPHRRQRQDRDRGEGEHDRHDDVDRDRPERR